MKSRCSVWVCGLMLLVGVPILKSNAEDSTKTRILIAADGMTTVQLSRLHEKSVKNAFIDFSVPEKSLDHPISSWMHWGDKARKSGAVQYSIDSDTLQIRPERVVEDTLINAVAEGILIKLLDEHDPLTGVVQGIRTTEGELFIVVESEGVVSTIPWSNVQYYKFENENFRHKISSALARRKPSVFGSLTRVRVPYSADDGGSFTFQYTYPAPQPLWSYRVKENEKGGATLVMQVTITNGPTAFENAEVLVYNKFPANMDSNYGKLTMTSFPYVPASPGQGVGNLKVVRGELPTMFGGGQESSAGFMDEGGEFEADESAFTDPRAASQMLRPINGIESVQRMPETVVEAKGDLSIYSPGESVSLEAGSQYNFEVTWELPNARTVLLYSNNTLQRVINLAGYSGEVTLKRGKFTAYDVDGYLLGAHTPEKDLYPSEDLILPLSVDSSVTVKTERSPIAKAIVAVEFTGNSFQYVEDRVLFETYRLSNKNERKVVLQFDVQPSFGANTVLSAEFEHSIQKLENGSSRYEITLPARSTEEYIVQHRSSVKTPVQIENQGVSWVRSVLLRIDPEHPLAENPKLDPVRIAEEELQKLEREQTQLNTSLSMLQRIAERSRQELSLYEKGDEKYEEKLLQSRKVYERLNATSERLALLPELISSAKKELLNSLKALGEESFKWQDET